MQSSSMTMILSGLYVGSYDDARDETQLKQFNISHIITLLLFGRPHFLNRHYLCISMADSLDQKLLQFVDICNDFIHGARLQDPKNNVLIHCYRGYSRSVSIAIAYLMSVAELRWYDAWKVIHSLRLGAQPNLAFQTQLRLFENTTWPDEQSRLRNHFPSNALQNSDRIRCRGILDNFNTDLPVNRNDEFIYLYGLSSRSGVEPQQQRNSNEHSIDDTSRYSDNSEDDEDADDEDDDFKGGSRLKNSQVEVLKVVQTLQQLTARHGSISANFERKLLMPKVVYYRPLTGQNVFSQHALTQTGNQL